MEYMTIDETYSPLLHRINQAVSRRAVHPDEPVQPPAEVLLKWSKPPEELVKASQKELNRLIAAADVKKGIFKTHTQIDILTPSSTSEGQRKTRQAGHD